MKLELTIARSIPLDPRDAWEQAASEIVARRTRGLTAEVADEIVKSHWRTLDNKLAQIFKGGAYSEAGTAFDAFDTALATAAAGEYVRARKAATNGVEERLSTLEAYGWFAKEQDAARQMIVAPEKLERVDFFTLITNQRTITRDEIRAFGRPVSWTNNISWAEQWVSDREVREMQDEAARREREAARGLWADNRNMDLPDPRG